MRKKFNYLHIGIPFIISGLVFLVIAGFGYWDFSQENQDTGAIIFAVAFLLGALAFLTLGIAFTIKPFYDKKRIDKLKQSGVRMSTDFVDVKINRYLTVNGKSPYAIRSTAIDPSSGKKIIFKSDFLWYDPGEQVPPKLTVMVDPGNIKNYYMDISFLDEE